MIMNSTTATIEPPIAILPFSTVSAPSVGLMISSLIGVLLSAAGKLPALRISMMCSTSCSVIVPPLIMPRSEIVVMILGALSSVLSRMMPRCR